MSTVEHTITTALSVEESYIQSPVDGLFPNFAVGDIECVVCFWSGLACPWSDVVGEDVVAVKFMEVLYSV